MILRYSWNACDPKKLHPKHQGNPPPETVSVRGPSGWVLQTDLVANLCCRSPGATDEAKESLVSLKEAVPQNWWFPVPFFEEVVCHRFRPKIHTLLLVPPENPCFTKKCFPTKIHSSSVASWLHFLRTLDSRIRIPTDAKRHPGGQVLHPSMAKFYHLVEAIRSWKTSF